MEGNFLFLKDGQCVSSATPTLCLNTAKIWKTCSVIPNLEQDNVYFQISI